MADKPPFVIKVLNRTTNKSSRVGVGWVAGQGIILDLDDCVILQKDSNLTYTLFHNGSNSRVPTQAEKNSKLQGED